MLSPRSKGEGYDRASLHLDRHHQAEGRGAKSEYAFRSQTSLSGEEA